MSSNKIFLHDHPVSSYAQKVRIALREKGIPFDKATPENLGSGQPNAAFSEANPRMEVPVLIDGDFKIFESSIIIDYLEERYPEHKLLPADPRARAEARMIEFNCDTSYEAANWTESEVTWAKRATGDLADKLVSGAQTQTREIHKWLLSRLGDKDFFSGTTFGYADLVVVPYVNRTFLLGLLEEDSPLYEWRARVMERPSVSQTYDEMEAGVQAMMPSFSEAFKPGSGRRREYRDHRLECMIKHGGLEVVQKGIEQGTIRFSWPGDV